MPAYNKMSYASIIIPSTNWLLDDENYKLLSPKNYMLYDVKDKCVSLRNSLTDVMQNKEKEFHLLFNELTAAFGTNFCEIEGEPLDLVDINLKTTYQEHYNNLINAFDSILEQIAKTNEKLVIVENALVSMHSNYLKRYEEVDYASKKYNTKQSDRPQRGKFSSEETYLTALSRWRAECSSLKKEYESLDDALKKDLKKSLSYIEVTWYCEKRRG